MTNKTEPMKGNDMITEDYDRRIHSNIDASAWARFYCERFPDADEGTMIGWFANAMMAMHDHMTEKSGNLQAENARLGNRAARMNEALQEIEYLTTNAGGWFDQPGRQFAEYARLGDIAKTAHTGD